MVINIIIIITFVLFSLFRKKLSSLLSSLVFLLCKKRQEIYEFLFYQVAKEEMKIGGSSNITIELIIFLKASILKTYNKKILTLCRMRIFTQLITLRSYKQRLNQTGEYYLCIQLSTHHEKHQHLYLLRQLCFLLHGYMYNLH